MVKIGEAKGELKFLTQNTQLLPGEMLKLFGQCKAKYERVPCIIDLIGKYDIIGLQEVFDEDAQNKIVRAWHTGHHLETYRVNLDEVILSQKQEVADGQRIIDGRPNDRQAQIVFDKHFVMGPDQSNLNQDGGLIILTKGNYPLIAASGFVFKKCAGLDCISNKGALYARVQVGPSEADYIHVFNTHLQAHDYPEVRTLQLGELKTFIERATNKDGGHPIVLLGDLNIVAEKYLFRCDYFSGEDGKELIRYLCDDCGVNWAKEENAVFAHVDLRDREDCGALIIIIFEDRNSVEIKIDKKMEKGILTVNVLTYEDGKPQYTTGKTHNLRVRTENDNLNTYAYTPEYEQLLKRLPQDLVDLWEKRKPSQPGHTWIEADPKTKKDSPWGGLGNQLAGESDTPQRIDYIFYDTGTKVLTLNPKSVSRVPSGPPKTLYCFDDVGEEYFGLVKSEESKEYFTQLEGDRTFYLIGDREEKVREELESLGITLGNNATIRKTQDGAWTLWFITGRETVIVREAGGKLYAYREKCNKIFEEGEDGKVEYLESGRLTIFNLIFRIDVAGLEEDLSNGSIPDKLREKFNENDVPLSENAAVETVKKKGEWPITDGEKIYVVKKRNSTLYVYKDKCDFRNYTVSDHLGVEMSCVVAPPPRIKRIEVQIGTKGNITVTPKSAEVDNGDHVEWHIKANGWGAHRFELELPRDTSSPFGNVDENIVGLLEELRRGNSVTLGPIEWPKRVRNIPIRFRYTYHVRFSKGPEQVSLTVALVDP